MAVATVAVFLAGVRVSRASYTASSASLVTAPAVIS